MLNCNNVINLWKRLRDSNSLIQVYQSVIACLIVVMKSPPRLLFSLKVKLKYKVSTRSGNKMWALLFSSLCQYVRCLLTSKTVSSVSISCRDLKQRMTLLITFHQTSYEPLAVLWQGKPQTWTFIISHQVCLLSCKRCVCRASLSQIYQTKSKSRTRCCHTWWVSSRPNSKRYWLKTRPQTHRYLLGIIIRHWPIL